MHYERMIDEYLAGPTLLQDTVSGMSEQTLMLDRCPVNGRREKSSVT